MRSSLRVIALALVCLGGAAASARAQDTSDPAEDARFRAGALRFTPSIVVSNLGVDSNVFNESNDPKQDTIAAVGPAVDLWLKMGQSRLAGNVAGQYLYFKEYDNQRAWNTRAEGKWDMPMARLTPFINGGMIDTKDRPGYEIDARIRLKEEKLGLGTSFRLSKKSDLVLGFQRSQLRYDDQDLVVGDQVAERLDRRTDVETIDLRTRLTPLTTFVVRSLATQERFDNQPARDGDSLSVAPGFEFRPEALISGHAFVGVKHFNALREVVPDYTGIVSDVGAKYSMRATQFEVKVSRDLTFSYEVLQPYYTLTDTGLIVTQRVTSKWDLVGRSALQSMAYRNMTNVLNLDERTDHSWQLGGGVGYRVAPVLRVGVDASYYRRTTESLAFRNYEGLRMGASFSYGLPQ